MNYTLRATPQGWKAWDVTIEGISYVKNFQNDFGAEINDKGLEHLILRGRGAQRLDDPFEDAREEAATGLLVGLLDAAHRVAHERLVEDDLLAGQREQVVGVGARWELGGDAGVGLAAPQQERLHLVLERVLGELAEFAGRLCYMSQRNPAGRTTREYLENIKKRAGYLWRFL